MTGFLGLISCYRNTALENKLWVLEAYGEPDNLKSVLKGKGFTITFERKGAIVSGSDGCNAFTGTYKLKRNKISFPEPFIVTLSACGDETIKQSSEVWSILGANESYNIDDGKLTIITGNNRILIFKLNPE